MPHDLLGGLPECGGWTGLALALTCADQADSETAERIKGIKPWPVYMVGGN